MQHGRIWALLAALVLSYAGPAAAFKMTPIEAEFSAGRQAVQTFKIENPGTQPVAIELTVHQRGMATDGSDVLTAAPDAFTVFPDQIVLQPGQTQSVRVHWQGQEIPSTELAYRLQAEQLPIDVGSDAAERSGLRLLVKYMASLYVRPADPAAALSASIGEGVRDGQRVAIVRLRNDGNAHAAVQAPMIDIRAGGARVESGASRAPAWPCCHWSAIAVVSRARGQPCTGRRTASPCAPERSGEACACACSMPTPCSPNRCRRLSSA